MPPKQLGPYRLGRMLGRGGMGAVFEGVDMQSGERAAVKLLPDMLHDETGFRQRFEVEINVLRKLRHPNIVRLLGFGEEQGVLYYAMELVDGASLQQCLKRGDSLHWRDAVAVGIGLCGALRHAHDRGIIHRDLKPANVLIEGRHADTIGVGGESAPAIEVEHVKLSDFGIARLFGETRLTSAGAVIGTIEFMAPEQAAGEAVNAKSDLYSLGAVLYSLFVGRVPFEAKSLPEILRKQRVEKPEPLHVVDTSIPPEINRIVLDLLTPAPGDRPASPDIVRRRLEEVLEDHPSGEEENESDGTRCSNAPPSASPPSADFDLASRVANRGGETIDAGPSWSDELDAAPLTAHRDSDITSGSDAGAAAPPLDATIEAPLEDVGSGSEATSPSRDDMPTSDLGRAPAAAADGSTGLAQADQTIAPVVRATHFTPVREDDLDPREQEESPVRALMSVQTWVLVLLLLAIGGVSWFFLQSPTADQLHSRISATISDGTMDSYRDAKSDMERFVSRFPNDKRSVHLRDQLHELELYTEERRLERMSRSELDAGTLLPVVRAYLEAIAESREDPEGGIKKLRALVDLYAVGGGAESSEQSGPAGLCVELAKRRLKALHKQLDEMAARELELLDQKLARATAIENESPQRAEAMRRAIIELYGDKPWAAPAVEKAEKALASPSGDR